MNGELRFLPPFLAVDRIFLDHRHGVKIFKVLFPEVAAVFRKVLAKRASGKMSFILPARVMPGFADAMEQLPENP